MFQFKAELGGNESWKDSCWELHGKSVHDLLGDSKGSFVEKAGSELHAYEMGQGVGSKTEGEIGKMMHEIKPCQGETVGKKMVSLCISAGL